MLIMTFSNSSKICTSLHALKKTKTKKKTPQNQGNSDINNYNRYILNKVLHFYQQLNL